MTAIKIMFAILICIPLAAVSYFFLKKLVEQIEALQDEVSQLKRELCRMEKELQDREEAEKRGEKKVG